MKKSLLVALAFTLAATVLPAGAQAPNAPAPQPGQPAADPNARRNFDPAEFRKQMGERVKTALKATDEEWTVLQPMIEKIFDAQRAASSGRFRPPGGNNGGGTPPTTSDRPGAAESQALRDTLANDNATKDEIQSKLTAVRDQRKKAQADLEAAREDLKKVVTLRQEAALVSMGLLD